MGDELQWPPCEGYLSTSITKMTSQCQKDVLENLIAKRHVRKLSSYLIHHHLKFPRVCHTHYHHSTPTMHCLPLSRGWYWYQKLGTFLAILSLMKIQFTRWGGGLECEEKKYKKMDLQWRHTYLVAEDSWSVIEERLAVSRRTRRVQSGGWSPIVEGLVVNWSVVENRFEGGGRALFGNFGGKIEFFLSCTMTRLASQAPALFPRFFFKR